jgi:hypothetical protein
MFAGSGDKIPPCGVPVWLSVSWPTWVRMVIRPETPLNPQAHRLRMAMMALGSAAAGLSRSADLGASPIAGAPMDGRAVSRIESWLCAVWRVAGQEQGSRADCGGVEGGE